jgi:hypothetical protein
VPLLDTFSGEASVVALSSHVSDSGHSWTALPVATVTQALVSTTGAVYNEGASSLYVAAYMASWSPPAADYEVTATVRVVTTAGRFGLMARASGSSDATSTYYLGLINTQFGQWQLWKVVNGGYAALGSADSATLATNDTLTLRVEGSSISIKKNGTTVLGPFTDSGITGAGKAGIWGSGAMSATTGLHYDQVQASELSVPLAASRGRVVNAGGMGPITRASFVNAGGH